LKSGDFFCLRVELGVRNQIRNKFFEKTLTLIALSTIGLSSVLLNSAYSTMGFKDKYRETVHKLKIAVGKNPFRSKKVVVPDLPPEEARARKEEYLRANRRQWDTSTEQLNTPRPSPQKETHHPYQLPAIKTVSPMPSFSKHPVLHD
jgi:hypothetical protein